MVVGMTRWRPVALSVVLSLALFGAIADDDHLDARRLKQAGQIMPLEAILETVRERYPGRVLEVELERESEGYIYEIEILDRSGEVWELEIDAVNGRLLKSERED
jgi:uncharacterized membrane protein YkoI